MKAPFEGDTILQELIKQVIDRHDINTVVETGTETGATAEAFSTMVGRVFTCDVENKLDRELPRNVSMVLGDSAEFLDVLLPGLLVDDLDARVLFFLDAHLAPKFTRLFDELEILAGQSFPDIVVVIHDFQVPDRPELGWDSYDGHGDLRLEIVKPFLDRIYPSGWSVTYNSEAEGAKRGVAIFSSTEHFASAGI